MKTSVFFDLYQRFHENKDPGQIPLGLMELGVDTGVVTVAKQELADYKPAFSFIQGAMKDFYDEKFWLNNDSEVIIAYPIQGALYSPMLEKMKMGKKKILLKFDSDGKIAYPLQRHCLRIPLRERLTVRNVISDLWWRLPFKSLKRRKHAKAAAETIKQIELCEGAIIESPGALANLNYFLAAWGRSDLIKKTHFTPNPVTPEFVKGEVGKKQNIVVSHGRWDDYKVKNTPVMAETIVEFLKNRPEYKAVIFGSGIERVKELIAGAPQEVKDRIELSGYIEHQKVKGILSNAKMLFVPSRWESFSIAAAEALCTGCSIVGTPAEALQYLSMQGFSGTTSATFEKDAILAALLEDALKWDNGDYEPEKTAAFWRAKLNRKTIAESIEHLAVKS
jgi:glycosyltransferase involved in cell wall biosynthesis